MTRKLKRGALLAFSLAMISLPLTTGAFSVGSVDTFNVERSYDSHSRNSVEATLHRVTNELAYYVEKDWWEGLSNEERGRFDRRMYDASVEFERVIHPQMTSMFGSVPDHPVDKSERITVLFHRMNSNAGGYVNTADQYAVFQSPRSNERNMLYINTVHIEGETLENFLAHELMHLITFNAKERRYGVTEDIWLNEARAEYVPTMLGYDGGSTERRISSFSRYPETSLTRWRNSAGDYGAVKVFVHYLVDHYGVEILIDSLKSDKVGIESINEALRMNGHSERFSDIFTDWTVAVLVNDCSLGERYCYLNPDLKDLMVAPSTNFLPLSYGSSYSARRSLSEWSAIWQRVIGGTGVITLEFEGDPNLDYRVPYLLCENESSCTIGFIDLNDENRGVLVTDKLGGDTASITFIPSLQTSTSGRESVFDWRVIAREPDNVVDDNELVSILLARIAELRAEVARLTGLINGPSGGSCQNLSGNLAFGSSGSNVTCLQQFLRDQGPTIYPEGLVTGNFLALTRNAVIRFQETHASEILAPLGLERGTGYVGELTRRKMNEILGS